jgi:hypothetical protein
MHDSGQFSTTRHIQVTKAISRLLTGIEGRFLGPILFGLCRGGLLSASLNAGFTFRRAYGRGRLVAKIHGAQNAFGFKVSHWMPPPNPS